MKRNSGLLGVALIAGALAASLHAQDNPVAPWGAPWGINGTSQATGFPVLFDPGLGSERAWVYSPNATLDGAAPPGNWTQIVFDEVGNLYWRTQGYWKDGVFTSTVVSVAPDGVLRWVAPADGLGDGSTDIGCVVGADAVYVLGVLEDDLYQYVYALDKTTGATIWKQFLDYEPSYISDVVNRQATPALHDGVLYVTGVAEGGAVIYVFDAANGDYLNDSEESLRSEFGDDKLTGNAILIPDVFGAGVHGLYTLGTENTDDKVYAVSIDTNATPYVVEFEWEGLVDDLAASENTSHLIYSLETDTLFTYTSGYNTGETVNAFDPVTGVARTAGTISSANQHKGNWPNGALDFGSDRFFTAALNGTLSSYPIDASGNVGVASSVYTSALYGIGRQFLQLLQTEDGRTVAVTGTDMFGGGARFLMIDVDDPDPFVLPDPNGPIYIDNVEVVEDGSVVFSEDFEGLTLGALPGQNGWTDTSHDSANNLVSDPAQVVVDPEDSSNQVLMLMPSSATHTQCVSHAFTQLTGSRFDVNYRQWLSNNTQMREVDLTANPAVPHPLTHPATMGGGWTGRQFANQFEYEFNGGGTATKEKGWDDILVWNLFANNISVAFISASITQAPWIYPAGSDPQPWAPTNKPDGVSLGSTQFTPSTNLPSNVLAAYGTEAADSWLGAHLVGGPLVGPDGKMYAFINNQAGYDVYWHKAGGKGQLWAIKPVQGPQGVCADANCDLAVNAFDIDPFVVALVDKNAWEAQYACDYLAACDINGDGAVNAFDIDPFVVALVSGACQ